MTQGWDWDWEEGMGGGNNTRLWLGMGGGGRWHRTVVRTSRRDGEASAMCQGDSTDPGFLLHFRCLLLLACSGFGGNDVLFVFDDFQAGLVVHLLTSKLGCLQLHFLRLHTAESSQSDTHQFFFSRVNILCWLLFWYLFHPCVTVVARKRSWLSCRKCRWQVTAKHSYTLSVWLCMKWHGCMVYTGLVPRWCGTSHGSVVSTPLRWIFKKCAIKS